MVVPSLPLEKLSPWMDFGLFRWPLVIPFRLPSLMMVEFIPGERLEYCFSPLLNVPNSFVCL